MISKIKNLTENPNIIEMETKLNSYIAKIYTDEQKNQILKAKENNLFLFLNDTFLTNELREIRSLLLEKKFDDFIKKYEKRKLNRKTTYFEYLISTYENENVITVEINNSHAESSITSSSILNFELQRFRKEKEMTLFKKLTTKIYKENFPITNPRIDKALDEKDKEYIIKLIDLKYEYLRACIFDMSMRPNRALYIYHKIVEIENLMDLLVECKEKIKNNEELSDEELILINRILNQKKYDIFRYTKYKE